MAIETPNRLHAGGTVKTVSWVTSAEVPIDVDSSVIGFKL